MCIDTRRQRGTYKRASNEFNPHIYGERRRKRERKEEKGEREGKTNNR